ncbi:DUF3726 domain-containing protein [Paraburkholderia dipogonis]|uniref:DUF3726 domain-containing protein n=1 Tax=Paraburkholderia dipogonis TaxID=1211383 RepID=UPI001AD80353|nr:DUF3726 domain-containing protein [Paraburkholderia dipogonis]
MKMALNELNALCRSELEGSGWAQGDYEDAAQAAVWLQAIGFDGMEAIGALLGATRQEAYTLAPARPGRRRAACKNFVRGPRGLCSRIRAGVERSIGGISRRRCQIEHHLGWRASRVRRCWLRSWRTPA